jgi:phage terminase large subunit-like protein
VLADRSLRASPAGWGKEAVTAYHAHRADRLVAEVNNGGAMVKHVIETADKRVGYQEVHASRGKQTRAEPVAALYEQGRVHHVGTFPELEDQMCSWVPGERSPDRMDALVWAITELMLDVPGELTSDPAAHTAFWERGQAAREALWGLP